MLLIFVTVAAYPFGFEWEDAMKHMLRATIAICALVVLTGPSSAAEKLKVVASFSILGDFVENVGKDNVSVTTLVGPNGDAHVYEPTPTDVKEVSEAQVIITNGLGLEGWILRLLEASGTKAQITEASKGVVPRTFTAEEAGEGEGVVDPHAFQSIGNAKIYVDNIAKGLCAADASDCKAFQDNAVDYIAKLDSLENEVKASIGKIPAEKRRVITSHDAFGYFAHEYGLTFLAPEGVSTEAEASAADVAKIVQQIREQKASALFVENISDPRLIEQIARETGLKVSGELYSDALSAKDGPAATYMDMMRHNVSTIVSAIHQGS
jgi:zinc/manganese transport system substrate-binding protein